MTGGCLYSRGLAWSNGSLGCGGERSEQGVESGHAELECERTRVALTPRNSR